MALAQTSSFSVQEGLGAGDVGSIFAGPAGDGVVIFGFLDCSTGCTLLWLVDRREYRRRRLSKY